jgi:hypothetical protein
MREIKFRAWDKKMEKMREKAVVLVNGNLEMYHSEGAYVRLSEDSIPMQFTGLKDKNGKEIYEGDIIGRPADGELPHYAYQVEFENGQFGCNMRHYGWKALDDFVLHYVVIGNICENPDKLDPSYPSFN